MTAAFLLALAGLVPGVAAQDGDAPLVAAARAGRADKVAQLLDRGEAIDAPDKTGTTPLIEAATQGHTDVVRLLLERGAKVDQPGENGTALAEAVYTNHFDIADLLLARGADVNARNAQGSTALFLAAYPGEVSAVRYLLSHGADPEAVDARGRTALELAREGESLQTRHLQPLRVRGLWGLRPSGPQISGTKLDDYRQVEALVGGRDADGQAGAGPPSSWRPGPPPGPALSRAEIEKIVKRAAEQGAKEAQKKPAPKEIDSDVDKPSYRKDERPDDFALVVGVEKYANDLPEAQFADRDAAAVREHLIALGFPARNIKLLKDGRASRSTLEAYLEDWLPRSVNADSRVFFYFAGHGAPEPATSEGYLVLSDSDPNYLARTGFPLKRLYADLRALKARRVMVALDSCFSGAGGRSVLAQGERPLVSVVGEMPAQKAQLTVFSATSASEVTGTLPEQGHGLFTYYFLKGLSGAAKDAQGTVTPGGLYEYLKPKVEDAASLQNRQQTPLFAGDPVGILARF
jgi:hypothetical protein